MRALMNASGVLTSVIRTLLLTLAYALGVGLVAVVFRVTGRGLLVHKQARSSWVAPGDSGDTHKMY